MEQILGELGAGQAKDQSDQQDPPDPARRKAIKAFALVAVGGCVALLGSGVLPNFKPGSGPQSRAVTLSSSTTANVSQSVLAPQTKVRVRYFQMSSALPGVSEEYFVLQSPADYSQLRDAVVLAHPKLASMMSNMMVLIDGVVAKGGSPLKDGDEVDFIPTMAGG